MSIAALWVEEPASHPQPPSAARPQTPPPHPEPPSNPASGALRLRRAPRREPRFDDEVAELRLVGTHDQVLPFEPLSEWTTPSSRSAIGHWPADPGRLPEPTMFARRILIAVVESFSGRRTLAQLGPYLSRSVFAGLHEDATDPGKSAQWRNGATVSSVHVCEPADGVAEVAAVLRTGLRSRAAALRLEARNGRWQCVLLQIG